VELKEKMEFLIKGLWMRWRVDCEFSYGILVENLQLKPPTAKSQGCSIGVDGLISAMPVAS